MRFLCCAVAFSLGLVSGFLLDSLHAVNGGVGLVGTKTSITDNLPTYLDFLSVMLTAITVVLTALGIGIGVVAVFTFRDIKAEASKVAEKAVRQRVDVALSDEKIRSRIDEIALGNMRPPQGNELERNFDPSDANER